VGDSPRYVWYGDDFTGAADTLATVAATGLRTCLFLAPPTPAQRARVGTLDALGIAGTARALAPERQRAELAPVAACFETLRPSVVHYKCCSTYDSALEIGNLQVGLQALRPAAPAGPVMVLGGQPSLGRYCAFGELFATAGEGGEVHRIDRHPTMSRHPVTPMHEADLRRHLGAQGLAPMALIDLRQLDAAATADAGALDAAVDAFAAGGMRAVLFDATRSEHLERIGRVWWRRAQRQPLLALGPSSAAQALIAAWPQARHGMAPAATVAAASGPTAWLVGSQSPVTAAQVAAAGERYAQVELDVAALTASGAAVEACASRWAQILSSGRSVLMRTAPLRDAGPPAGEVSLATGRLLARLLALAPGLRRVGVAGGDTSSWSLRALDPWALQWAGQLAPGVPLLRAQSDDPRIDGLELVLKGGQMGPPDLFGRLQAGHPG
jgi:3-oxoisoapionate kinase